MPTLTPPRDLGPGDRGTPVEARRDRGHAPTSSRWGRLATPAVAKVLVGTVLVVAVVLRFAAVSDLWLDEAQSVAIATQPFPGGLLDALRADGAPPLYYLLLAGWTAVVGTSDLAVRALSGVAAVAALPLVAVLGRRVAGPATGRAALLLLASSPFAVRYATEARMYALVVLLTAAAGLVLLRVLDRPGAGPQVGLGVLTGLLLLTHYWALFLVAAVGLGLLARTRRGPPEARRAAWRAVLGVSGGGLLFVPWLPVFAYQMTHTGSPWAAPVHPSDLAGIVGTWAVSSSFTGSVLFLVLLALVVLGVAGRPGGRGAGEVVLDLRGVEPGRTLAGLVAATLLIAFVAGLTGSAFAGRYTSVVLVPALLVMALGLRALASARARRGLLAAAVLLGLAGAVEPVLEQRTQAGEVAAEIVAGAQPGDVVAYCPDQLGPSVTRLLPDDAGLREVVYPTGGAPAPVDWVDYAQRNRAADGAAFAAEVDALAGDGDVWLVWATGYRTFGRECTDLALALADLRPADVPGAPGGVVVERDRRVFESMQLARYAAAG